MSLFTRKERTPATGAWSVEPAVRADDAPIFHPIRAAVDGLFLSGTVAGGQRLSDALNAASSVRLATTDPSFEDAVAGGSRSYWVDVDTRDIEIVLGEPLQATEAERRSRRIHKVRYPVVIWTASFQLVGVIHVFAGTDPEYVGAMTGPRYLALTQAQVWRGQEFVSDSFDVALVNRRFIHAVRQTEFAVG